MAGVGIGFSDDWFIGLNSNPEDAINCFGQLLSLPENRSGISEQLQNYHSDEDGAPIVRDFDIVSVSFDPSSKSGKIRFSYRVDFTFACADKRATTNHFETSNFDIDPAKHQLTIKIHDKISRDTFEEF